MASSNSSYTSQLQEVNGLEYQGGFLSGTGTIIAQISFTQNTHIRPGHSPGQLTLQGSVSMDDSTVTEIQLGGRDAGTNFDQVAQNSGDFVLGGKLLLSFVDGFEATISPGDSFDVITSDQTLGGAFSNFTDGTRLATSDGLGTFVVSYSGTSAVAVSQFRPKPKVTSTALLTNHHFKIQGIGVPQALNR